MGLDTTVLAGRMVGIDREPSRRLELSSDRPMATASRAVAVQAVSDDSHPHQA